MPQLATATFTSLDVSGLMNPASAEIMNRIDPTWLMATIPHPRSRQRRHGRKRWQISLDNPRLQRLSPDDRLIVSEPFSDLPGLWQEIPEGTAVTVRHGGILEHRPFRPQAVTPAERPEPAHA